MTSDLQQSRLEAARTFVLAKWQPVPLLAREKRPMHPDWPNRDFAVEDLEKYFSGEGNIGLKCGDPSGGLVDVDIDDTYALAIAPSFLSSTKMRHGRKGSPLSHYWYRLSDGAGDSLQFKDPDGSMLIELRSTGRQTAVPPSIHPSGEPLEWCGAEREPSEMIRSDLVKKVSTVAAAALIARHWPAEGSRNDASLALAGALLRGGMEDSTVEEFLRAVADAALDEEVEERVNCVAGTRHKLDTGQPVTGLTQLGALIGKPIAELAAKWLQEAKVITTAVTWGEPFFFHEQTTPAIPAGLLPGPLGVFARELAAETEVPEALTVMAVLGVLSTALAKRVVVSPQQMWEEPVNIYVAVALPPGSNKSLVLKRCTEPLVEWERNEQARLEPVIKSQLSRRKSEELLIERARREAVKTKDVTERNKLFEQIVADEAALQSVLAMPQLFANDLTPEALATTLREQDGRLAVISDEGGIMETMAGLYTRGSANVDVLLKGIDGGHVRICRKNSESFNINPYLTLILLVQPQILQNMAGKHAFHGNGTLERFLFVLPESRLGYRKLDGPSMSATTAQGYKDVIGRLLALPPNIVGGTLMKALPFEKADASFTPTVVGGTEAPYTLTLSPEASRGWTDFRGEIEAMLRPTGKLAEARGWGGKLAGFTLRIAGLLHMSANQPPALEINDTTMQSSITLARLLIDHAIAARNLMGTDQAAEDAKVVLNWLKLHQRTGFTRTECLEAHRGRLGSSKRMDAMLTILLDRNIIAAGEKAQTGAAGRPPREYRINPRIYAH